MANLSPRRMCEGMDVEAEDSTDNRATPAGVVEVVEAVVGPCAAVRLRAAALDPPPDRPLITVIAPHLGSGRPPATATSTAPAPPRPPTAVPGARFLTLLSLDLPHRVPSLVPPPQATAAARAPVLHAAAAGQARQPAPSARQSHRSRSPTPPRRRRRSPSALRSPPPRRRSLSPGRRAGKGKACELELQQDVISRAERGKRDLRDLRMWTYRKGCRVIRRMPEATGGMLVEADRLRWSPTQCNRLCGSGTRRGRNLSDRKRSGRSAWEPGLICDSAGDSEDARKGAGEAPDEVEGIRPERLQPGTGRLE
ncbi:hypothetical protein B0H11DRAFT_2209878 [Mycena galericulata]|nr:hypothetical protein B0H11DRAFT_2209878 [Mycena galericulata]